MRQHETWTGAANPGDKTFGVGSVEGSVFTVGFISLFHIKKLSSIYVADFLKNHSYRCNLYYEL